VDQGQALRIPNAAVAVADATQSRKIPDELGENLIGRVPVEKKLTAVQDL